MNRREQELLAKQLRWLSPSPRSDGVMILGIVAAFVAGITLAGVLFAHESDLVQTGSNDAMAAISPPNGPSPPRAFQTQLFE